MLQYVWFVKIGRYFYFFHHNILILKFGRRRVRCTLLFLYPNVKSIRKEKYFFITAQKHIKNNIVSI